MLLIADMCHNAYGIYFQKGRLMKRIKAVRFFLIIYIYFFSILLLFLLSLLTFVLLHVHHAGCDDRLVSGLAAVGHPGSGCRCPSWMAVLCSGWVGDLNPCLVVFWCLKIFTGIEMPFLPVQGSNCR